MTYNETQTGFVLAMLAYLGDTLAVEAEQFERVVAQQIEHQLSVLRPQIGSWQLVWGPAFFSKLPTGLPDNVMYVARCTGTPGPPQLVVAIAGTNPFSFIDWVVEDLWVSKQAPWEGAAGAKISQGTHSGLGVLQTMKPGATLAGAGQFVRDFLAAQAVTAPVAITITGHSLGGALSPTLALWLHDTRAAWDPRGHASLSALPFAGPTAGNQLFAQYSDAQIGSRVTRVHNSLDLVPHAWASADLRQVASLYSPHIEADQAINFLVGLMQTSSSGGGFAQINAGAPALLGAVNQTIITTIPTIPSIPIIHVAPIVLPGESLGNFLVQAVYQHVNAYLTLLDIQVPSINEKLAEIENGALSPIKLIVGQPRLAGLRRLLGI